MPRIFQTSFNNFAVNSRRCSGGRLAGVSAKKTKKWKKEGGRDTETDARPKSLVRVTYPISPGHIWLTSFLLEINLWKWRYVLVNIAAAMRARAVSGLNFEALSLDSCVDARHLGAN